MHRIPITELNDRLSRLQEILRHQDISAALIVQNTDLYYFTGTMQTGYLLVAAAGDPLLFVRKDYERACSESALAQIIPVKSIKEVPQALADRGYTSLPTIGLELDVLPVNHYFFYQKLFPLSRFQDISAPVRKLRMIKSPYEIQCLRQAAEMIHRACLEVPKYLTEGMREIDLASQVEGFLRRQGHQGLTRMRGFNQELYYGHLLSGENGAVPSYFDGPTGGQGLAVSNPQGAGWRAIGRHEPVTLDYTATWGGYIVDQTRLFSLGPLAADLERAFFAALEIQGRVTEIAKPGVTWGELYEVGLASAGEMGYAKNFMGFGHNQVKFIGHGVGLEVDEYPVLAKGAEDRLEPGMVFALEPKMVFPGRGMVGIENVYLVTSEGVERITITPDAPVII